MKIGLAIPSGDDVCADFALSLLTQDWAGCNLTILNIRTSIIPLSRYLLVKKALEADCEAILFWDSDIRGPPDTFKRLLCHNVEIVGAVYLMRREPYKLIGTPLGEKEVPVDISGLLAMRRLPLGLCLIRSSVFRFLPRPWFNMPYIEELDDYEPEDYNFCRSARANGYDIWCDLDLSHEIRHIGKKENVWLRKA